MKTTKVKATEVRWTVSLAAKEFGLDHNTLDKGLRRSGQESGRDGRYSTRQICAAVFGDMDGAKLRKMLADARLAEAELKQIHADWIERERMQRFGTMLVANLSRKIIGSSLTIEERDELLRDIKSLEDADFVRDADRPIEPDQPTEKEAA